MSGLDDELKLASRMTAERLDVCGVEATSEYQGPDQLPLGLLHRYTLTLRKPDTAVDLDFWLEEFVLEKIAMGVIRARDIGLLGLLAEADEIIQTDRSFGKWINLKGLSYQAPELIAREQAMWQRITANTNTLDGFFTPSVGVLLSWLDWTKTLPKDEA